MASYRRIGYATGFYEWKADGRVKVPYYIYPRNRSYMAFAALYDVWTPTAGQPLYSVTILTTAAEGAAATIHDRMPVMLDTERAEDAWLDPQLKDPKDVLALLAHNPAADLEAHPVSRRVNTPSVDEASLIERIEKPSRE
jgi:putative SOS response-associated peptidase YedK